MLNVLLLAGALATLAPAVKPPDYTERSLCQVWAGAQCHRAQCGEKGHERCVEEGKRCLTATRETVSRERAAKVAGCARAMLKLKCGAALPAECQDVELR